LFSIALNADYLGRFFILDNIIVIGSEGQDGQILRHELEKDNCRVFRIGRRRIGEKRNPEVYEFSKDFLRTLLNNIEIKEIYFYSAAHTPADVNHLEIESLYINSMNIFDMLLNCFELVKIISPKTKIFFASSALIFGDSDQIPQDENTPMKPIETYGLFKKFSHDSINYYREVQGLFISSGILYPHESKFRKSPYLFPKILNKAISASKGDKELLRISDFNYKREWNCALQINKINRSILKLDSPDDFVVGSGTQYSVLQVLDLAFSYFELDYKDYVEKSNFPIINRSANLKANPLKLIKAIGVCPDGNVNTLIKQTYLKLGHSQS
jgi:GDP-D-mannose dehydratase